MVLWLIPLKMEDECSSLEFFHTRDPKMNGTERPSVGEGISYDTYYKFFNILLTSPTIFPKFTDDSSNNHISPNLPLQPSSHETSHTLQLIFPTLIQIYNFLYMTLDAGV